MGVIPESAIRAMVKSSREFTGTWIEGGLIGLQSYGGWVFFTTASRAAEFITKRESMWRMS